MPLSHWPAPATPGLADWSASLSALPRHLTGDVEKSLRLARRFNREVVAPLTLRLDAAVQDDPDLLPHEFVQAASAWRLYSRWLPRAVGGDGWNFLSLYAFLEEVSSACVGLANVIGVHYLGAATLMASWNLPLMEKIFRDVSEGDRTGDPRLLTLAITEPAAGTDMEETQLLGRARIGTFARALGDGGYMLNGRKVFISNGHLGRWHMVVTCEDRRRPADTGVLLAVRAGDPGFELGAREEKMGQKACVASELVFNDCHLGPDRVAYSIRESLESAQDHRKVMQTIIDYVVSSTRAGVGAFAAGVARGSYQAAQQYARHKQLAGSRLIERQWVQTLLADMAVNAQLARSAWLESALANCQGGLFSALLASPLRQADRLLPGRLQASICAPLLRSDAITRWARVNFLRKYPRPWQDAASGLGSLAKVACSDLAMQNVNLALDLMGADGLRHENGAEKRFRDAKLLQIYEGTNQLNRINLFKCRIAPDGDVPVFQPEPCHA